MKNPAAETAGHQSQNSNSLSCSRSFSPIALSTSELRQRPQGVLIIIYMNAKNIYCNQIGMLIEFSYCISMNEKLPCRNIIGCWKGRTDIIAFLRENFTDEELKKAFGGPPKSRIERIIESIKKKA